MITRLLRVLIPVWLVTAAWDAVCASLLSVFAYHTPAAKLWQGVAATALKPFGGTPSTLAGLGVHLLVALTWSMIFVAAVFAWPKLRQAVRDPGGALAVAAVYGPIIWLVMSLVVIPVATGRPPRFGVRWWVQVFAHLPFVTFPLVFTARRMFMKFPLPNQPPL